MPEKTLSQRRTLARKRGKTLALKATDVGAGTLKSRHALKKSRGVVSLNSPGGRSVDLRKPPGKGNKTIARDVAAYARATKNPGGPNPKPPTKGLKGRKKAPSRMGIKSKGGPFKRSRLHGG